MNMADVAGKKEEDRLLDVGVDAAAFLNGLFDRSEIVVGQDHVSRAFGDVGAGDAHGNADVGRLERRGIVDAVASHGRDVAVGFDGLDDLDFVLRRDPGEDPDLLGALLEFFRRAGIDLVAGHALAPLGANAEFLSDGEGGVDVVAGDHDGRDAGATEGGNGRLGRSPRRVDHAGEADEDEVLLGDFLLGRAELFLAVGESQDPEGTGCHLVAGRLDVLDVLFGDRADAPVQLADGNAMLEDLVHRAFGVDDFVPVLAVMEGRHHLPDGVEGIFVDAGRRFLERSLAHAEAIRVVDESHLSRVAVDTVFNRGVGAKAHALG